MLTFCYEASPPSPLIDAADLLARTVRVALLSPFAGTSAPRFHPPQLSKSV